MNMRNNLQKESRSSIKRRFLIFSILFFISIVVIGTIAFTFSMGQIVHRNAAHELSNLVKSKQLQLEKQLDHEIVLALKMADSPLIQHYFQNPSDPILEKLAFEEFAGYRKAFANNNIFWINDADKKYYFGNEHQYTLDPSAPTSTWYTELITNPIIYQLDVDTNLTTKQILLWIDVKVKNGGTTTGLVGTGIDITSFINSLYKDVDLDISFYFFNDVYEITGAKNQALIFEKKTITDQLGDLGVTISKSAKTLSNTKPTEILSFDDAICIINEIPSLDWYIVGIMPITKSMYIKSSMTVLFCVMLFILFLVFVIFDRFIFHTLNPLKELEQVAVALTNMNFNVDIKNIRNDEVGNIQKALLRTRDNLKKAIDELNVHIFNMASNSERMQTIITESSKGLNNITGSMNSMRSETNVQEESVKQTSNAISQIVKSIGILNQVVSSQSTHITSSSSAIEEMVANIASIRSVVENVSKTTDTLSLSSSKGHTMLLKLVDEIKHIQEQSATLQNANKTISDIAAKTNILAMNAAIEAAHAGEAGKGFAVVASEVRKLAELSSKESESISDEILKIEQTINQINSVSKETVIAMETIFTEIKSVDESLSIVNYAIEEQSAGGSQILSGLQSIQDMTCRVQDSAEMIDKQSDAICKEMDKLHQISENVTKRAREVDFASSGIASILENSKPTRQQV